MDRLTGLREVLKYEVFCQPHLYPVSPYVYQVDNRHSHFLSSQRITKASFKEDCVRKPVGYNPLCIRILLLSPRRHSIRLIGYWLRAKRENQTICQLWKRRETQWLGLAQTQLHTFMRRSIPHGCVARRLNSPCYSPFSRLAMRAPQHLKM
jgi:hypothetical protein